MKKMKFFRLRWEFVMPHAHYSLHRDRWKCHFTLLRWIVRMINQYSYTFHFVLLNFVEPPPRPTPNGARCIAFKWTNCSGNLFISRIVRVVCCGNHFTNLSSHRVPTAIECAHTHTHPERCPRHRVVDRSAVRILFIYLSLRVSGLGSRATNKLCVYCVYSFFFASVVGVRSVSIAGSLAIFVREKAKRFATHK